MSNEKDYVAKDSAEFHCGYGPLSAPIPEDERGHDGLTSEERIKELMRPILVDWGHECTVALRAENTALTAELAALQWQPITPENLPKVGDEVVRCNLGSTLNEMKHGGPYVVVNVNALYEWDDTTAQEFADGGWTHFRPINAPKTGGAA